MFITTRLYLRRHVVNGNLDGLAGRADVDHHQDVAVTDLRGGTNRAKQGEKDERKDNRNMRVSEN